MPIFIVVLTIHSMKLAIVIPTYKYHIPLLKSTLESIAAQTCAPDLVLVRASSCNAEYSAILAELRAAVWPFPLTILETEAVQYTAQNKNEGVAALPDDIDTVSFFDSDDIMHPRRIEFVKRYIAEGYDVVCHAHTDSPEWNITEEPRPVLDYYIKHERVLAGFIRECMTFIPIARVIFLDEDDNEVGYTDGTLTVRRECLNRVKYDTKAQGHQDCVFFTELHQAGYKIINLNIPLMLYIPVSQEEQTHKHSL